MVKFLSNVIFNQRYAEVRLIMSRRYNLFDKFFFPIDSWPKHIIEIFVSPLREISYNDRVKLATFFCGNGLSRENAANLLWSYAREKLSRVDKKKLKKLLEVMEYVKRPNQSSKYYYYDLRQHTVLYLNGTVRMMTRSQKNTS